MRAELEESSNRELLLWLLRLRWRFRVTGASMAPLLQPGDEVLVNPRAYRQALPAPGDIVVARHPHQHHLRLVKRVAAVDEGGRCFLLGDNPAESNDSRSFGPVARSLILGRVVGRFP